MQMILWVDGRVDAQGQRRGQVDLIRDIKAITLPASPLSDEVEVIEFPFSLPRAWDLHHPGAERSSRLMLGRVHAGLHLLPMVSGTRGSSVSGV